MKAVAKKPHQDSAHKKKHDTVHSQLKNSHSTDSGHQTSIIQLKPICPCDGGCPRCAPVIQPKLIIGQPNDKYEKEADRVADQIMQMPEPEMQPKPTLPLSQGPSCGDEAREKGLIQPTPIAEQITPSIINSSSNQTLDSTHDLCSHIQSIKGGGQELPESVRVFFEPRFDYGFSHVRVHTDSRSAESAKNLKARAYTAGHDIVFGAGQYAPETRKGLNLIAHELVHVTQRRPDRIMRGPFDSEDPALRSRRLAAIASARLSINRLINALSRGYIWSFETVTTNGVYLSHMGINETISNRERRLRELVNDLIQTVIALESAPISAAWLDPIVRSGSGSLEAASISDPAWTDAVMFYAHHGNGLGRSLNLLYSNIVYIMYAPNVRRTISPAIIARGICTGINIHIPDPENEPLVYQRVTGFERLEERGVILEVWHDSFGYYYLYRGVRHNLPGEP